MLQQNVSVSDNPCERFYYWTAHRVQLKCEMCKPKVEIDVLLSELLDRLDHVANSVNTTG